MKNLFLGILFLLSSYCLAQPLSGTYTIGLTGNYTSFSAVESALQSNGVAGPVTLNILTGTYYAGFNLSNIAGTSAVNTITVQSATQDADDVSLRNMNISTPHVFVKYLTFDVSANAAQTIGSIYANNVTFSNCVFTGAYYYPSGSLWSNSDWYNHSYINIGEGNNITITNNVFSTNAAAVFKSSTLYIENLTISNNTIEGLFVTPVNVGQVRHLNILNNTCTAINDLANIRAVNLAGTCIIARNKIYSLNAGLTGYGINIIGTTAEPATLTIKNNVLAIKSGISAYNFNSINIYNNSIKTTGGACLYLLRPSSATDMMTGYDIYNNIFQSHPEMPELVVSNTFSDFSILNADKNAFSKEDEAVLQYLGYNNSQPSLQSLTQWKSTSGEETNSAVCGMVFTVADDLHTPGNTQLNNAAQPLTAVTDDADGVVRSTTMPDIGAYEYVPDPLLVADLEVVSIVSPVSPYCEAEDAVINVKNNSVVTITEYDIQTLINNYNGNVQHYTTAISPGQTIAVPITGFTVNKNTPYNKIEFAVLNPNGLVDSNFSNNRQHLSNVLQLGAFTIQKEADVCGNYTLYIPKISNTTVSWSTGETSHHINVSNPGTYTATITSALGCTVTETITIN